MIPLWLMLMIAFFMGVAFGIGAAQTGERT